LAQGGSGYASYTPVRVAGRVVGYINLVFRSERFIHDSIEALDLEGFRLTISDDGFQILELGHMPSQAVPPASRSIDVMNRTWTVQVEPTKANAARQPVQRELLFLIGGSVLASFMAALIWLYLYRRESQRDTERRFRDYLEVSSDWYWETDENLRWSYFSDKYEEVSGVKASDLLGKTREEVGAPGADPRAYRDMLNAMRNRKPFRDFVHTREKNGSLVYLSISAKPAFDDDGHFLGYRGVGREVTEFYRNRRDLDEALVRAERASQAKSEFLATMSHEFRTPLNAILGFSDILKSQLFGPIGSDRYSDYAENIYSSGAHMLNLVDDILDISAIEAGKRQLELEEIDLGEVFKVCARTMESRVREKDLVFTVFETDPSPIIRTDRRAVLQILLNLLSNAVKFTPPKGRVSLAMETAEDRIIITVEDSGVGIPEEMLQEIMEPFVQSANDPLVTGTGSGLGLSIVKSLCSMIGATVDLKSTEGDGTTVRLSIPVSIEDDPSSEDDGTQGEGQE